MDTYLASLAGVTLVALVHFVSPWLHLGHPDRTPWVSLSAGIAIAYVFVKMFPDLALAQQVLDAETNGAEIRLSQNLFLIALAGFTFYLGVLIWPRGTETLPRPGMPIPPSVALEYISLTLYSLLTGYLIGEKSSYSNESVFLYGLTMAIHFVGLNHLMREEYPRLFDLARYGFICAVYGGWLLAIFDKADYYTVAVWYALLAGGIMAVVGAYELPHIRSIRRYGGMVMGIFLFATLTVLVEYLRTL